LSPQKRDALRGLSGLFQGKATYQGDAMPKLTSKVTMKIEPGFLEAIQEMADREGLPVSSYIRKAVISHIRGRQESDPNIMRMELTEMEIRAINRLVRAGVIRNGEDIFHRAFDLFMDQQYEKVMTRAERILIDDQLGKDVKFDALNHSNLRKRSGSELDLQLEPEEGDGEE